MDTPETTLMILARVAVAVVCGALLGWERESRGKPAGFRTQMMVCVGAALFTVITLRLLTPDAESAPELRVDPSRVIAGVIGGIGFLGAGSIIQSRGDVQGMTTAATIWVVGAIGVAAGLGDFSVAGVGTLTGLVVLYVFDYLSTWLMAVTNTKGTDVKNAKALPGQEHHSSE